MVNSLAATSHLNDCTGMFGTIKGSMNHVTVSQLVQPMFKWAGRCKLNAVRLQLDVSTMGYQSGAQTGLCFCGNYKFAKVRNATDFLVHCI